MNPTHLLINSYDREDYENTSPSNFRIKLQRGLVAKECALSFALIPNTFYNVTTRNNKFTIAETTYEVPEGSYSLTQLGTQLVNILSTVLPGFDVTYSDVLGKIRLSATNNFSISFTAEDSIARLLGFKYQAYNGNNEYLSDYHPHIYTNVIHIQTNFGASMNTSSKQAHNTTFVIPNNVNKSEIIQYYSKTQYNTVTRVREQDLATVEIRLLDQFGFELKAASEWSMQVIFGN